MKSKFYFVLERVGDFKVSLARSGSFMSSSINPQAAGHHSKSYRRSATETANGVVGGVGPASSACIVGGGNGGNGGAASDDSMHEKYFKSTPMENTPLSRRRHTTTPKGSSGAASASSGHGTGGSAGSNMKHSSDSSPQSPISPHSNKNKPLKISSNIMSTERGTPMLHSPGGHSSCSAQQIPSSHVHFKQDSSCSLELLNLDRLSLRDGERLGSNKTTSPHLSDITGHHTVSNNMTSKNFPSSDNIGMMTHSSRGSNDSRGKHNKTTSNTGSWSQQQQQENRNRGHNSMSLVSRKKKKIGMKSETQILEFY